MTTLTFAKRSEQYKIIGSEYAKLIIMIIIIVVIKQPNYPKTLYNLNEII